MQFRFTLCLVMAACVGLTACGKLTESKRERFDGVPFRVKVKPVNKKQTLADFRVKVSDATRSQAGALAAARHEATRYCIENYGTSKFGWSNISVDDEGGYALQLDGRDGLFIGTCKP